MKVLVIGGGGREHALAWKLAQSPRVHKVYVAPGNGGTALDQRIVNVPIGNDVGALADFAESEKIGLTVVGPEATLALGVVDAFRARGLRVSPSQTNFLLVEFGDAASRIEAALIARGIVLRPMGGYGLGDCLRITVGTADENARLLATLDEVLA